MHKTHVTQASISGSRGRSLQTFQSLTGDTLGLGDCHADLHYRLSIEADWLSRRKRCLEREKPWYRAELVAKENQTIPSDVCSWARRP